MSREFDATYRIQLHKGFGFDAAAAIVPYLAELGISHMYCSPYLQARRGSMHGYDVVDHSQINDELGGEDGHRALTAVLDAAGMGHVLDIVPNHMAVDDPANRWWWDVLKHGAQSRYAAYFDIDWDPPEARMRRHILVPILGDHYGRILEAGELHLGRAGEDIVVRYHDHVLPIAPGTVDADADLKKITLDSELLHAILERQHYRLAYWRAAGAELNYRRFFAINELAALRAENQEVFESTHDLVLELVRDGVIDGLRIDHIDGLRYPEEYLRRLRSRAPGAGIWVEKVLEGDEILPGSWPVDGTTGYEFATASTRLLINPAAEKPLSDMYAELTGNADVDAIAYRSKVHVMDTELSTDIERLTELFVTVAERHPRYRDFTRRELRQALRETIAGFDVYRTYADARRGEISSEEMAHIRGAVARAQSRRPDLDPEMFGFLEQVLTLRLDGAAEHALAMRFQQATGPIKAKGIEDTFFYRYNRFVALNEVGGDPLRFAASLEEWHAYHQRVQEARPATLLTTSTHDTKRSEDVRARLAVISEVPDAWAQFTTEIFGRWDAFLEAGLPDADARYLLLQTLVGAWPLESDRVAAYMEKASKEAKLHTSWTAPDEGYDAALRRFVEKVLADRTTVAAIGRFVDGIAPAGWANSLVTTALKLTCPGVPDVYQGTELWDLSLVDPDNRRAVDYGARRAALNRGHPKQSLIRAVLAVRKERRAAFGARGPYQPLWATGTFTDHVVAHVRGDEVTTIAGRFWRSRPHGWRDTALALPPGPWRSVLTDGTHDGAFDLAALSVTRPADVLVKLT